MAPVDKRWRWLRAKVLGFTSDFHKGGFAGECRVGAVFHMKCAVFPQPESGLVHTLVAQKPSLWVDADVHAGRKRPGRGGAVYASGGSCHMPTGKALKHKP